MTYKLPVFVLAVNIWRAGNPQTNVPDVACVGNLAYGKRISVPWAADPVIDDNTGSMWLLVPWGTDIRGSISSTGSDVVEVPASSGRVYTVLWVDDAGSGFANQHRFAEIRMLSATPTPLPPPIPVPGPIFPPPPVPPST